MEATGSVNTTTISKYVMEEKWRQQFSCCEERGNWRQNSGEEEADVGGLHCHMRPCDVWACAAMEGWGHVWFCDPTSSRVCVDVHGPCDYQRPCRCLWSGPPPEAMLMSKGHAELVPPLTDTGIPGPASNRRATVARMQKRWPWWP